MPKRKPDPEWDHVYFSNYRMDLLSASKWRRQADALFEAASLLEVEVRAVWEHNMKCLQNPETMTIRATGIFGIYFMLIAFAAENLLKARIIGNEYAELRATYHEDGKLHGKLPKALKSHELVWLAERVGFIPSLEEEDLMRRLTRAAVWAGRYPVPTEFRDAASSEEFRDGQTWGISYYSEDDPERVARFVTRLREELG
jgi:hypothetical protein